MTDRVDGAGSWETIIGDLIVLADAGRFDVVIHGCNCLHIMGAGVAAALAKRWPAIIAADRATMRGDRGKLGGWSSATVPTASGRPVVIANAYTQFDIAGRHRRPQDGAPADAHAIAAACASIAAAFPGALVGIPRIGCGLGGLAWTDVEPSIRTALAPCRTAVIIRPEDLP